MFPKTKHEEKFPNVMKDRNRFLDEQAAIQQDHKIALGAFYFKRIVLDEGHELFTYKMAKRRTSVIDSLMCIKAKTRW